jgi:probable F420-dependent oxidoreductase
MQLDMMLLTMDDLTTAGAYARTIEEMGFAALWTAETQHNPFLPLAVAATTTQRLQLGTAIAVAFPRSPTVLAHIAWDLQANSHGRFILGLGTQVKGHNERRFGVKWEAPAKKLREMIVAMRAIWDCWQNGTPLNFTGEFYCLTLMTPFFSPKPMAYPRPPIYIAGVNPLMCRLAGELCEGFHVHPLHSVKYLQQHVLPNIMQGAAKTGRSRHDIALVSAVFVITGDSAQELAEVRDKVRMQIAFYASTRSYWPVLETHGWGDVGRQLNRMAAQGDWHGMARAITDEMLDVYAVTGTPDEIPAMLRARYDGLLDRIAFYFPYQLGEPEVRWRKFVQAFHA